MKSRRKTWRHGGAPARDIIEAVDDPLPDDGVEAKTTPVSFASDLRPELQRYLAQMRWRFDLTSYDDVKASARQIYMLISTNQMPPPPFSPFSADFISSFKGWIAQGYPP